MWEQLVSGRVVHRFEPIVLAATLALILVLIIESRDVSASSDPQQDGEVRASCDPDEGGEVQGGG